MRDRNVRFFSYLLLVVFLSFLQTSARAQLGRNTSGTGGRNTIQGSIFLPSGLRSGETTITVTLESTTYSSLSVIADRNGGFAFANLTPGSYTIVIDAGESFVTTRESVYIDESSTMTPRRGSAASSPPPMTLSSARTIRVPIYLQAKRNAPLNNKILNAKLANVPKDAVKRYEKGVEFARGDKPAEAVAELKQALAIYPQFSVALAELGKQYLKLSNLSEAVVALRSAVAIDPTYFDAKLDYGIALLNKKELDDAEKQLKDAARINAEAVTPHYYLGLVFVEKRNLDEAQKELELGKKLSNGKGYPQINRLLGGIYFEQSKVYFEKKQYIASADALEKYLQVAPDAKDAEKIRRVIVELRNRK